MENLPGARAEINAIAEALSAGEEARRIETVVLAGQDAPGDKIDDYLLSGEIDVIHYSGHPGFDKTVRNSVRSCSMEARRFRRSGFTVW